MNLQLMFSMCGPHLWTLLGGGVEGAANYPPLGSLHAPANKLVIYGLLHKDAGAGCAALACIEKHTLVCLLDSQIHWGAKRNKNRQDLGFFFPTRSNLTQTRHIKSVRINKRNCHHVFTPKLAVCIKLGKTFTGTALKIWYQTPERQDPAVAHEGLTDPHDLWVSAEASDWDRVHSPDLLAFRSLSNGCLKHLNTMAPLARRATQNLYETHPSTAFQSIRGHFKIPISRVFIRRLKACSVGTKANKPTWWTTKRGWQVRIKRA